MPTYDLLTGTPVWHSQIRTPDGSAPRNATTEAGGLQDVADCLALLKREGPDLVGSVGDMINFPSPGEGQVFNTRENGQYSFTYSIPGLPGPFAEPFVKPSLAANGCWVSAMRYALTGNSNPAQIIPGLIPLPSYPRLVGIGTGTCNVFGAGTQIINTATSWTQVNDGTADLSLSITCAAGDHVKFSIGPIYGRGTTSINGSALYVQAHVVDGAAYADYPLTIAPPLAIADNLEERVKYLEFEHAVTTGPIALYLQAKTALGTSGTIHFDQFGPLGGSQWLRFEVIR